jgi:hypothetical protein
MTKMNGAAVALSEAEMVEAEVDRLLAEEVAKRRAALRLEVIDRMRREQFQARMARINGPHPSDFPPSAAEQARLDEINAASRKADAEKRAAAEARWAEQEKARAGRERLPRSLPGTGSEAFTIKR